MQGVRFKVISANDPDILQERLNRFVEELPENTLLVEVQFTAQSSPPLYAVLIQYKEVQAWTE